MPLKTSDALTILPMKCRLKTVTFLFAQFVKNTWTKALSTRLVIASMIQLAAPITSKPTALIAFTTEAAFHLSKSEHLPTKTSIYHYNSFSFPLLQITFPQNIK